MKANQGGFSLPELLVVFMCVAILATLAIPNLMAARRSANEASTIASMRTIVSAELTFKYSKGSGDFATLTELGNIYMLDTVLSSGSKSGYLYNVTKVDQTSSTESFFDLTAEPAIYGSLITGTGTRSFYGNESALIYYNVSPTAPTAAGVNDRTISNGFPLE